MAWVLGSKCTVRFRIWQGLVVGAKDAVGCGYYGLGFRV